MPGTFNLAGLQVWASECRGTPPYKWHKLLERGAGRGPANQMIMSMTPFKGALYIGTGIQGGGNDRVNKIGPAAAELIRINADDTWDVIVGEPRDVDGHRREPLSGLRSGFGNFFNGYMWALAAHNGWLYAGTNDWSVMLRWSTLSEAPPKVVRFFKLLDPEVLIANAERGRTMAQPRRRELDAGRPARASAIPTTSASEISSRRHTGCLPGPPISSAHASRSATVPNGSTKIIRVAVWRFGHGTDGEAD